MTSRPCTLALVCLALSSAGACAGAGAEAAKATPAWFETRAEQLNEQGYPQLSRAPAVAAATTDPAYWQAVQADLAAAETALRAHPRSTQPADAPEAQSFEAAAAAEIEAARGPR